MGEPPAPSSACPACGFAAASGTECPRCGVVFSRWRSRHPNAEPRPPRTAPVEPSAPAPTVVPSSHTRTGNETGKARLLRDVLLVAGVTAVALLLWTRLGPRSPAPVVGPEPTPPQGAPAPPMVPRPESAELDARDARAPDLSALGTPEPRMSGPTPAPAFPRNPAAAVFDPDVLRLRERFLLRDWQSAEAAARAVLQRDAGSAEAACVLAEALLRQDRVREAWDAATECERLASTADERQFALSLFQRLDRLASSEGGLREQQLAHFRVYYDGERHEALGREVVRVLESHYATLVSQLGHQPTNPIPVVLLANEAYDEVAARGSVGMFSHGDSRVRVRVKGLGATLTPQIERTLLHELVHAFAYELSAGTVPRDVNEGLAEYMEGTRVGFDLSPQQVSALRGDSPLRTWDFYLGATSFVEFLIGQRGMGGIGDLLRRLGQSRNLDRAFSDVYGSTHAEMQKAWLRRLEQRAGL